MPGNPRTPSVGVPDASRPRWRIRPIERSAAVPAIARITLPSMVTGRIAATIVTGAALVGVSSSASFASEPQAQPAARLADVTLTAGLDFVQTIGDGKMTNIVESTGVGCGFLDYDGDGLLDIYLVNGCWREGLSDPDIDPEHRDRLAAATDRLYRNRGDGTFKDVTIEAGLAKSSYGMGVVVADYDGDGDPDIYVTNYGPNLLYRNNGDKTFTDVATDAGIDVPQFSAGAVFLDYNRDGQLDLYVGNYVQYDPDYSYYYAPDGFPGPLAYTGQQDRLFRGNADDVFTDVTDEAGIKIRPLGRAMGVGAFDYDNDGFPDVFVSNDAMENFLLHNRGDGTFDNQSLVAGVAFGEAGEATAAMAVELADYDGDGLFDAFIPDMRYSCLYHNNGGGFFDDVSAISGIAAACGQYVSWGGVFADFDLDGNIDLYISNGDVHHLEAHEDLLLLGDGEGRFTDVSEEAGEWSRKKFVSRGVAGADFDNDGDIDLLVASLNNRPVLLRNDTPRRGRHWLGVRLMGRSPNRDAIGAIVRITIGEKTMIRHRTSGGSYLSQHDPRLHFGIGNHQTIDVLEVIWPDGSRQIIQRAPVDQYLTIHQEAEVEPTSRR